MYLFCMEIRTRDFNFIHVHYTYWLVIILKETNTILVFYFITFILPPPTPHLLLHLFFKEYNSYSQTQAISVLYVLHCIASRF